jgi:hypothetical protein
VAFLSSRCDGLKLLFLLTLNDLVGLRLFRRIIRI